MTSTAAIRKASDPEIAVLADNFRKMWVEIGWSEETIREDWADAVAAFADRATAKDNFAAFVAELDGEIVGTAACQVFSGLYPEIRLKSSYLAGYIWGIYVRPDRRRLGLATKLTRAALDHLDAIGCNVVKLHASQQGEAVYRAMGFCGTNELSVALSRSGSSRTSLSFKPK